MDFTSLIEIVIVVVIIYFFIKFIVSPVVKAVVGVVIFLVLIYLLQRYFGFDFGKVLTPFGLSLDSSKWGVNLNWLSGPVNYYIDQIKAFLIYIWGNFPKP